METVRPVTLAAAPLAPAALTPAPRPATAGDEADRQKLEPAVSVELTADGGNSAPTASERRRIERDEATQALVYRVTDSVSGELIVQIPDAMVLKARAYAQQVEAAAGARIERLA